MVVSGDVYDRALPPVDAVELADDTFARLAASRAPAWSSPAATTTPRPGSASTPGWPTPPACTCAPAGRTSARPVLLEDAHGPVAVYGLPYLEPDAVRTAWELPDRSHEAALTAAMTRVDADLDGRPGHPIGGAGPRVRRRQPRGGGADGLRQRARHLRRRHPDRARPACSPASTTPRSATCTGGRR